MSDHVYKLTEIVGTSGESLEKAIGVALERAQDSIRHVHWFEVSSIRGYVHPERGMEYQVALKIGFGIEN